jgi:hypothetical protein
MLCRQRRGDVGEVREPRIVDVDGNQGNPGAPARRGPDDVHEPHGARRADHGDAVVVAQRPIGGRDGVPVQRRAAGRPHPPGQVIVDPSHVHRHGSADGLPAQHHVDHAARCQVRLEPFDDLGVRTEVDDVVERFAREGVEATLELDARSARIRDGAEGEALGLVRDHRDRRRRGHGRQQWRQPLDRVPRVRHDQQATARRQRRALAGRVRRLDAGPRLEERDCRPGRLLVDRDQEAPSGPGLDDHPLVQEDVLLEPALEVVAERRVRGGGRQMAVVGLDEDALAGSVAAHVVTDRDDPARALVPRHRRPVARDVAGVLGECGRVQAREHVALPRMRGEGVEQLGVGEADPDRLDLHDELGRAGHGHGLGPVVDQLPGTDDLDRVLGRRQRRDGRQGFVHLAAPRGGSSWRRGGNGRGPGRPRVRVAVQLSITWPPVTGRAWPVSYRWAIR